MSRSGTWRDVPCGHPPDPVAMLTSADLLVCHCGWILDKDGPLIQPCRKCGCAVAKHVPAADELEAFFYA